jgi:hypothetical protein
MDDTFGLYLKAMTEYITAGQKMAKALKWHEERHGRGPCAGIEDCGHEALEKVRETRNKFEQAFREIVREEVRAMFPERYEA